MLRAIPPGCWSLSIVQVPPLAADPAPASCLPCDPPQTCAALITGTRVPVVKRGQVRPWRRALSEPRPTTRRARLQYHHQVVAQVARGHQATRAWYQLTRHTVHESDASRAGETPLVQTLPCFHGSLVVKHIGAADRQQAWRSTTAAGLTTGHSTVADGAPWRRRNYDVTRVRAPARVTRLTHPPARTSGWRSLVAGCGQPADLLACCASWPPTTSCST